MSQAQAHAAAWHSEIIFGKDLCPSGDIYFGLQDCFKPDVHKYSIRCWARVGDASNFVPSAQERNVLSCIRLGV
jgi:hypothetical protein